MKPIYPYIQVEPMEDKGALVTIQEREAVVTVKTLNTDDRALPLHAGDKIVVRRVHEFMDDKSNPLYFVHEDDIICIL